MIQILNRTSRSRPLPRQDTQLAAPDTQLTAPETPASSKATTNLAIIGGRISHSNTLAAAAAGVRGRQPQLPPSKQRTAAPAVSSKQPQPPRVQAKGHSSRRQNQDFSPTPSVLDLSQKNKGSNDKNTNPSQPQPPPSTPRHTAHSPRNSRLLGKRTGGRLQFWQ